MHQTSHYHNHHNINCISSDQSFMGNPKNKFTRESHQFGAKMKIWKIKGKGAVCMNKKGGWVFGSIILAINNTRILLLDAHGWWFLKKLMNFWWLGCGDERAEL